MSQSEPSNAPLPSSSTSSLSAKHGQVAENVVMKLGSSIVITGELSASEDLTLYGQMDGRVTLPGHTLTIGPDADIRAEVAAKAVLILGAVRGNVTANETVAIRGTGSVVGDIVALRLAMDDGAQLQGKVKSPPAHAGAAKAAL